MSSAWRENFTAMELAHRKGPRRPEPAARANSALIVTTHSCRHGDHCRRQQRYAAPTPRRDGLLDFDYRYSLRTTLDGRGTRFGLSVSRASFGGRRFSEQGAAIQTDKLGDRHAIRDDHDWNIGASVTASSNLGQEPKIGPARHPRYGSGGFR